jgi:multicomponent Na+:H+ antiporter subunit A
MAVVAGGAVLGVLAHRRPSSPPRPVGANAVDGLVTGVLRGARSLTARTQHGSLPIYLVTMAATAAAATVPFLDSIDLDVLYRWDSATQAVLAVFVVALAVGAAGVGARLGAALGLGAVGLAVAGLFVAHGAPDLALTQLLVETVIVVGFVVGLGHLARRFPPTGQLWRSVRLAVAGLAGTGVMAALVASASAPSGTPPTTELARAAVDEGGGNNIVNVILTDMRALDTLGEVVVLVVVAVGILALAHVGRSPAPPTAEPVDVLEES